MDGRGRADRSQLVATARAITQELRANTHGTGIRILPARRIRAVAVDTGGWVARIGKARGTNLWLEIWLDRYTRHPDRKLYAGFYAWKSDQVNRLARRASHLQGAALAITDKDVEYVGRHWLLKRRFTRNDFIRPLWEQYSGSESYYGFYEPNRRTQLPVDNQFKTRAVDFILEVAAFHRTATPADDKHEVYPRYENRKLVAAHLRRERSGYLAAERKRLDDYQCAICARTFATLYGKKLGEGFAEAHHVRPLKHAADRVRTHVEDLITVCSNCHRMLHKMSGQPGDVAKLRAMVRRYRKAWR